jgi:prepilin-type N-terminal cleavage/methylation domain-containing protein
MKKYNQAFTLIEMLVVIAIIALLAAILVPTVTGAIGKAATLNNMNNVRSIGQAIQLYAMDHKNRMPVRYGYSNVVHGRNMHWQEQIVDYVGRDRDGSVFDYQKADVFKSSSVTESFGNHFGLNKFMFESYPQWDYYLGVIPNPSGTVIVGEINKNTSYIDPEVTPVFDGKTDTYYRISNHKQMGIYMFADFHVEQLKGDQGMSENPDIWKWW